MKWYLIAAGALFLGGFAVPEVIQPVPPLISMQQTESGSAIQLEAPPAIPQAPTRILNDSLGVAITAQSALIMDKKSGAVLWQKNQTAKRPIASIAKLMTFMVVLDVLPDLATTVDITKEDYTPFGPATFSVGEQVRAEDVLATAVIASDNTAARALARETGLSREEFVKRMNAKAAELGLKNTFFADTTGLSNDTVSTAEDVLALAQKAFSYPKVAQFAGKRKYSFTAVSGIAHTVTTTNRLIGSIVTVVYGKTGFVTESGYNLVAQVTDVHSNDLVGVVLGSATNDDRFQDFKMLSHWAWENYTWPVE